MRQVCPRNIGCIVLMATFECVFVCSEYPRISINIWTYILGGPSEDLSQPIPFKRSQWCPLMQTHRSNQVEIRSKYNAGAEFWILLLSVWERKFLSNGLAFHVWSEKPPKWLIESFFCRKYKQKKTEPLKTSFQAGRPLVEWRVAKLRKEIGDPKTEKQNE